MVSCSKALAGPICVLLCGYDLFLHILPSSRQTLRIVDQARAHCKLRWHGELLQQWQTSDSASAEKKTLVAKVVDKFPAWQRNLRADQHTLFAELGRLRSAADIMISAGRYWITRQLPPPPTSKIWPTVASVRRYNFNRIRTSRRIPRIITHLMQTI